MENREVTALFPCHAILPSPLGSSPCLFFWQWTVQGLTRAKAIHAQTSIARMVNFGQCRHAKIERI